MKWIKDLFIGIILFIVAVVPTTVLTVITIVFTFFYYLISFKWKTGISKFGKHLAGIALSVDQLANKSLAPVLNIIMVKKGSDYHPYGDEDDTLSYCVAMNGIKETDSKFAKFWESLLEFIDPGHLDKAIANKIERDMEAIEGLEEKGLI